MKNKIESSNGFSIQEIKDDSTRLGKHFRITDADDNRVATCYLSEHAQMVMQCLNERHNTISRLIMACRDMCHACHRGEEPFSDNDESEWMHACEENAPVEPCDASAVWDVIEEMRRGREE